MALFFWCSTIVLDNGYQRLEIMTLITVILLIQIMNVVELSSRIIYWTIMFFQTFCQFLNLVKVGSCEFILCNVRI